MLNIGIVLLLILIEGLVVDAERMRRNLDATQGLVFSHRLLLALVESGVARDDAYGLVQRHAMQAWEEETSFRRLVEADPDRFYIPPYVGHRGWIGVRLDRGFDRDEIAAILEDAYAEVAPPKLVEAAQRGET